MKYFTDFTRGIRNHKIAWLFAFFVGLLVIFPTIFSIYNLGFENWRGVYPMFNDDEGHYLAMAKEAADGHMSKGSVFLNEHKDNPAVSYGLAENIFGLFSRIFNTPVPLIFAINDFFLPFIGFMMLYFLFFAITKNKKRAVLFSAAFYAIFLFSFGRPINPQFSFIFLVSGILLIWKIFENLEREDMPHARFAALLGADIGFLVYIYPYYWTALFALYALLSLFLFIKTRKFAIIKNSLILIGVLALTIIPYAINFLKASANPFYQETILRYGMLENHFPATYLNVALLFFAFIAVFLKRNELRGQQRIFAFALPLAGVILNWQNVITGKYLQFSSHYYQVTILFIFITLALVFYSVKINLKNIASSVLVIFLMLFIFYHQSGEIVRGLRAETNKTDMMELQSYRPIFDWLNANTKPDSVVLVLDEKIAGYLPIYTRNNLYSYGYAGYYLVSDDELEDRWVRQNIFNDKIDAEFIKDNERGIWANKFIDAYQNASVRNKIISKITGHAIPERELVPEVYIDRVFFKYDEAKKEETEKALKKYKIDYILLDTKTKNGAKIAEEMKESFLAPLEEFGSRIIYKVN